MGREHLEARDNWQAESAVRGGDAERAFNEVMRKYCIGTDLSYASKPRDLSEMYGPRHGIAPDGVIRNTKSGRAVYVEIKRQRNAGNAHERACKYFAPGIIASAREVAGQPDDVIPFWWIFSNGIASDPRYVQEIMHWFRGVEGNVLLWQSLDDYEPVIDHFERYIAPMLG